MCLIAFRIAPGDLEALQINFDGGQSLLAGGISAAYLRGRGGANSSEFENLERHFGFCARRDRIALYRQDNVEFRDHTFVQFASTLDPITRNFSIHRL